MKKLILSVLVIASLVTYTSAQQAVTDASKWSVAIKGGDVGFRVSPEGLFNSDNLSWGAGAAIERTVNPLFGYGLELNYLNSVRKDKGLKGSTIDPTLFGSINLTNLLSNMLMTQRKSAFANVYANFGVGAAFYNKDADNVFGNKKSGVSPLLTASLHPELNITKALALGLEVGYRYYGDEVLGGIVPVDRTNDALSLMGTLRFKLGDNHVRNLTVAEYFPAPAPTITHIENPYDDSKILSRLDNLDREAQGLSNRLSQLEGDVKGLKDKPAGETVTASFQNVEFEFDSAKLTADSYATLDQVAAILLDNPTWSKLTVKGHTDSVGPEAYNQRLSDKRANAVKDYLAKKGVKNISAKGYGESQPIATNDTAEGRQANRRVEFEIAK